MLGTGHKVCTRVGRSDLGWAMENILLVWMGRQFFLEYLVGPPNQIQSLSVKMCENNCKNFNVNVHNIPDESLTYRCAYKLLDTFLFIKILPEQDTMINELYSSHLESPID